VKEGLDTHTNYWFEFIPALETVYQWAGRCREVEKLCREMMRWGKYCLQKAAWRGRSELHMNRLTTVVYTQLEHNFPLYFYPASNSNRWLGSL